jgi:hypothetical protein
VRCPPRCRPSCAAGGKQLLRLRLTEPQIRLSLAGAGIGRYERRCWTPADLPLPPGSDIQWSVS